MEKNARSWQRRISRLLAFVMVVAMLPAVVLVAPDVQAASPGNNDGYTIENDSMRLRFGYIGQIEVMNILNDRANINFAQPANQDDQNGVQHQYLGEMLFSTRSAGTVDGLTGSFVEQDINKTLANPVGGAAMALYEDFSAANADSNQSIAADTSESGDGRLTFDYIGHPIDANVNARAMKGYDVRSEWDADSEDGSITWNVTLTNKSDRYIEFGDIGLPMAWNNKYMNTNDVYNNRLTVHSFAGADSGYFYGVRSSGVGNYVLFAPDPSTGAQIEYVEHWQGNNNGVTHGRVGSLYAGWYGDPENASDGWPDQWFPGLSVVYQHAKNQYTISGAGYFPVEEYSSLILKPAGSEDETYDNSVTYS